MSFRPVAIRGRPIFVERRRWNAPPPARPTRQRYRTRSAILPSEMDYSMTADHVIDDPRQPQIMPTGVFDHRGMMILRVSLPITQTMGFGKRHEPEEDDHVHVLVPEDMLMVTDTAGHGVAYVDTSEVQDFTEQDDEDDGDED